MYEMKNKITAVGGNHNNINTYHHDQSIPPVNLSTVRNIVIINTFLNPILFFND